MARVWPVYDASHPTYWEPWADLPVSEAIELLELKPGHFLCDLQEVPPRFGNTSRDLTFAGFKHVVAEIDPKEALKAKWKPGFYRSKLKPRQVFERLIKRAITSALGANNVARMIFEPTTDSFGREALRITVVIEPGAIKKFAKGASLDALVRVQEQLSIMRDERTPIIEYATEEELAHDASP